MDSGYFPAGNSGMTLKIREICGNSWLKFSHTKSFNQFGLNIKNAFFNADKAFDLKIARKTCFNHGLIPNMPENKRNRKKVKRGRKRLFNAEVYKRRFVAERSFAWIDKFKRLLIRFECKSIYFLGAHYIAFTMINLRHILA